MTHRTDAKNDTLEYANTEKKVAVNRVDLPLSCPLPNQKLWNAHPRVYLPVEDEGGASCPYCGTHYVLSD